MGLLYGLASQYINVLALPGVPLAQPPQGRLALAFWSMLGGGLVGLLAAWPEEALPGILFASLAGTIIYSIFYLWNTTTGIERLVGLLALMFTLLPRGVLFLPFTALIRWSISRWSEELRRLDYSISRLGFSLLVLVLLSLAAGGLSLYPRDTRQALNSMHSLMQMAMKTSQPEALPPELKDIDEFLQQARGDYTLQVLENPDQLPIRQPSLPYGVSQVAILARFTNGFSLGCIFAPGYPPMCSQY